MGAFCLTGVGVAIPEEQSGELPRGGGGGKGGRMKKALVLS